MNVTAYIDYFRQMAIAHKDLQHKVAGETGDAPPETVHFARWSADELISGRRSKVAYPALLLEMFEITTHSEMMLDVANKYNGAFSIAASALIGNHTSEVDAFTSAERIMTEMLQRIWADHYAPTRERCETPFEIFNFHNLNIIPFGPILNNEFGFRCEFAFMFKRDQKFSALPPANTFLNITNESSAGSIFMESGSIPILGE